MESIRKRAELKKKISNFIHEHHDNRLLVDARSDELVVVTHFSAEGKNDYAINNFPQETNSKPFAGKVLVLQK